MLPVITFYLNMCSLLITRAQWSNYFTVYHYTLGQKGSKHLYCRLPGTQLFVSSDLALLRSTKW